jgi:hypothetical protein
MQEELIDRLTGNVFVGWASLGEGSFRKPAPPKIQHDHQVDILDFGLFLVDAHSGGILCERAF